jgi:mannosyltransferase
VIETGSRPALAPRTARALLVGIFLIAAVLRVSALSKPYYIDEISTLTVASQSIDEMAGVMRKIDASPALYPLTLHYWIALSHADAWVRLLSALFGLAAVWAAYWLARLLFGERTAVYTALIVALAPIHIEYAQYVRSYSLFTFVAVMQLWAFSRCLVSGAMDPRRVRPFVWLALATTAMFYTHYLSMLILIPEGVYALWRFWSEPRRVAATGAAVLAAAVLFAPGIPLLQHNLKFDALRKPDLFGELALGRRDLGFTDPEVRRTALSAALALVGASLVAGIVAGWRRRRDATILMALTAFLPIFIYIFSGRKLIAVRFFLPCGIALLVLAAHGMASAGRRWGPGLAAALALVCVLPIAHFVRSFAWSYGSQAISSCPCIRSRSLRIAGISVRSPR